MPLNIPALLARLSARDRLELLHALQVNCTGTTMALSPEELWRVELWFLRRMRQSQETRHAHSRTRMYLIFMLLRYGGLRLREIMALKANDCQFAQQRVILPDRDIMLSRSVALRLGSVWNSWSGACAILPMRCESSQVRRSLARCAAECGIAPQLLNASGLRRLRAQELEALGLHPRLVAWYLGQEANPAPYSPQMARQLVEVHLTYGVKMKTSARNLFYGPIKQVKENGILVEATIQTESGLEVVSVITKTSRESLGLAPGKKFSALVKAPWVSVLPLAERAKAPAVNCFEGKVENIQQDDMACEILVRLGDGQQICALYANGAKPANAIEPGSAVVVSFSPFAVILTEN